MAKSKNNVSSLIKSVSRVTSTAQSVGRSLRHTDLVSQVQAASAENRTNIRASGDTRQSSPSGGIALHSIQFGKPSESGAKPSSASGSEWANLLRQTASGGVSSALSGGLGGIGGLGSIVSNLVSLFGGGGGKKSLPPLVDFQLPNSQEQTLYVGSKGSSVYQGNVVGAASVPAPVTKPYSTAGQLQISGPSPSAEWIQEQSAQIADAVKNALLNSSSLNDVIGEI
jgi:hypothetical protein